MWTNRLFLIFLNICVLFGLEEEPIKIDIPHPSILGPVKENQILQCPEGIKCIPKIQCPMHLHYTEYEKPRLCTMEPAGKKGFCCPNATTEQTSKLITQ